LIDALLATIVAEGERIRQVFASLSGQSPDRERGLQRSGW